MLKQVILLFYLLFLVSPVTATENFAQQLLTANLNRQPLPHYSQHFPQITEQQAYMVQRDYVTLRKTNDPIAGYKAGLTSTAGQKKFNVSQALSGVLFSSGFVSDAQKIQLDSVKKLMIETEIGFILSKNITQPITDVETLKQMIDSVVAVIELPNLGYAKPSQLNGVDLIASNLASHQFLLGNPIKLSKINAIDAIETRLLLADKVINNGKATDALSSQWHALTWLINHLLASGFTLSEGNLLITGALGKMIPAQKGIYQANFGQLGQLSFSIN
ncbi:2-keto-4-pentenoate hydratase [Aliikangiella maris]|uniref:Fumarylacetoacetate hydrolase family protein n=2 Tax=Aliikangiella maris TaxID=3162458 RepID=A0ABV2BTW7_9GAMM